MKNAAFRLLGDIGLVVHNARNPNRQEWDEYLAMSAAAMNAVAGDMAKLRRIVFTDGGGPNGAQRRAAADLLKQGQNSEKVRVAVVTRSNVVRGIVTAYRWLGLPLRAFLPEELALVFAFLVVTREETQAICAAVLELCAEVAGPIRSAAQVADYRLSLAKEEGRDATCAGAAKKAPTALGDLK